MNEIEEENVWANPLSTIINLVVACLSYQCRRCSDTAITFRIPQQLYRDNKTVLFLFMIQSSPPQIPSGMKVSFDEC